MCPYYLAREMQAEADIVFMPYNYILDIKVQYMYVCMYVYIYGSAGNCSSHSPIQLMVEEILLQITSLILRFWIYQL